MYRSMAELPKEPTFGEFGFFVLVHQKEEIDQEGETSIVDISINKGGML